jgi:hypothetical protein
MACSDGFPDYPTLSASGRLPLDVKAKVLQAVRSFDTFDNNNDPHQEHDFGSLEVCGETYFF